MYTWLAQIALSHCGGISILLKTKLSSREKPLFIPGSWTKVSIKWYIPVNV